MQRIYAQAHCTFWRCQGIFFINLLNISFICQLSILICIRLFMQITKIAAGLLHSACIDGKAYRKSYFLFFFQHVFTYIFFLFVTVQKMVRYLYLENR